MIDIEGLTTISAERPGPTVAIFGGVHGDERAGVRVVKELASSLTVDRGTVHLVLANLRAIESGDRFTEENLNRCFVKDYGGTSYEAKRARELLPVLDDVDALLDLHEHSDDYLGPFLICERPSIKHARRIGAPVISFGWTDVEAGGTDGYMHSNGKVGVCYESGPSSKTADNEPRIKNAVSAFLAGFGLRHVSAPSNFDGEPRFIRALRSIIRRSEDLRFGREFRTFEALKPGELILTDGGRRYVAGTDEVIIFPRPEHPVGTEVCIIGREEAVGDIPV